MLTFWWHRWSNRNKLREGELPIDPGDIARRTRDNVLEYMEIYTAGPKKVNEARWRPLAEEMLKFNVDGSFLPGENFAG